MNTTWQKPTFRPIDMNAEVRAHRAGALAPDAPPPQLDAAAPAALVTLVDIPLVRTTTVTALLRAWEQERAVFVRPLYEGRHGHPVIFGRPLLDALVQGDPAEGARPVVRSFAREAIDVPVDDPGVLIDLDTPEEYARYT